jgi:hypothetical protein
VRLHDESSCGGDHSALGRDLIVPNHDSAWPIGGQFHNGSMKKNLSTFGVRVLICADQSNIVLFRKAKRGTKISGRCTRKTNQAV